MKRFSKELHPKIGHYVYLLIDPRDNNIFYVGKGQGDRIFAHAKGALKETEPSVLSPKIELIKEIIGAGEDVEYRIVRWNLENEKKAFEIESILIDLLTNQDLKKKGELKNKIDGRHSSVYGIQTPKEIEAKLTRGNLDTANLKDKLLAISLNQSLEGPSLYERVRGNWKLNRKRVEKVDYVLAVYDRVIIGVFKPEKWEEVEDIASNIKKRHRLKFSGEIVEDKDILDRYLYKKLPAKSKGNANPIKYLFK
ncbi:MAG: hypothetical protein J1E16_05985 [Muribaculaceae bacterium]|nr:hypothetical protein [Muribaculaceae bacterium]